MIGINMFIPTVSSQFYFYLANYLMRSDESRSNIFNLKIQKRYYKSAQKFQIWNILHLGFRVRWRSTSKGCVNLPKSADLRNRHFWQVQYLYHMRFSFVFKTVSCHELSIVLPQSPECSDYRSVPTYPASHIHVNKLSVYPTFTIFPKSNSCCFCFPLWIY